MDLLVLVATVLALGLVGLLWWSEWSKKDERER